MNYIGSKYSLLDFIHKTISNVTGYENGDNCVFADLFAGTGIVGASYRKKGYNVISNDIQYYSYVINKYLIEDSENIENSFGIEIQRSVAKEAYDRIITERNDITKTKIIVSDSKTCNMNIILESEGLDKVQFVILHPPYWDIIKFSENPNDLSNCNSINDFLNAF